MHTRVAAGSGWGRQPCTRATARHHACHRAQIYARDVEVPLPEVAQALLQHPEELVGPQAWRAAQGSEGGRAHVEHHAHVLQALVAVAFGALDLAHNLVTPLSWGSPTEYGGVRASRRWEAGRGGRPREREDHSSTPLLVRHVMPRSPRCATARRLRTRRTCTRWCTGGRASTTGSLARASRTPTIGTERRGPTR